MEKSFKKNILIGIIVFLAVIAIIGLLFFNKTKDDRVPEDGFYPLTNYSYYAFSKGEKPVICFDTFFVNNTFSDAPERIEDYSNLKLVSTESDVEVPINLSAEDFDYFKNTDMLFAESDNVFERVIEVDLSNIDKNISLIQFDQMAYHTPEGKQEYKSIGTITVELDVKDGEEITALSQRLEWTRFEQPTFSELEYAFHNQTSEEIRVTDISFAKTGVKPDISYPVSIAANEEVLHKYAISLENEVADEPMFYALKPKFEYEYAGEKKTGTFENVQIEKYLSQDIDINELLCLKSK